MPCGFPRMRGPREKGAAPRRSVSCLSRRSPRDPITNRWRACNHACVQLRIFEQRCAAPTQGSARSVSVEQRSRCTQLKIALLRSEVEYTRLDRRNLAEAILRCLPRRRGPFQGRSQQMPNRLFNRSAGDGATRAPVQKKAGSPP